MPPILLKIGGSLFDLADLGARLSHLLHQHRDQRFLLFPGGGDAANLVRGWQPRFGLTDAAAHDLAVQSLDFNAALLATILPSGCCVRSREEAVAAWSRGEYPVLAPSRWIGDEERLAPTARMPHTWDVTSDSLAAWTACRWFAVELWLCKSIPCPPGSASAAGEKGDVDSHFAHVIGGGPKVRWCNLRDDFPIVIPWE